MISLIHLLVQCDGDPHVVGRWRQHADRAVRGHALGPHSGTFRTPASTAAQHLLGSVASWSSLPVVVVVVVVCVRCIDTPQGKRKPYILLSAALACGGLLWLPHATDLPSLVASYLMLGIGNALRRSTFWVALASEVVSLALTFAVQEPTWACRPTSRSCRITCLSISEAWHQVLLPQPLLLARAD